MNNQDILRAPTVSEVNNFFPWEQLEQLEGARLYRLALKEKFGLVGDATERHGKEGRLCGNGFMQTAAGLEEGQGLGGDWEESI